MTSDTQTDVTPDEHKHTISHTQTYMASDTQTHMTSDTDTYYIRYRHK